jgi:hypothetical protein
VISPEEAKKIAVKDNTFLYVNVAATKGGRAATVLAQFAQAAYVLRNSFPIGTALLGLMCPRYHALRWTPFVRRICCEC